MTEKAYIFQRLKKVSRGNILIDEPLSGHTSFKIGGPADIYIQPVDQEDVVQVIEFCNREGIPRLVIGNGTNMLVSDDGWRGVVIDISKAFSHLADKGNVITAGAGVTLKKLIRYCRERGLAGLEALAGIPGQVGGGLVLNAGAFGTEIMEHVISVRLLNGEGRMELWKRNEIKAGYRKTNLPVSSILIEAQFALLEGNPKAMEMFEDGILKKRRAKQPLSLPSAGSVFKRPPNDFAGRLIEEAGLKGFRIGDAMVSRKHANFIVNCHLASARDVMRVIEEVRETVKSRFGVTLEPEIHLIGFGT
ncbi:UDP-N-acetylmuramate dehydrogenase [bacterium]|nr:UDP-N-acetylmuramate dehydrogenase [bacterium]